jgi:ribonuclease HI
VSCNKYVTLYIYTDSKLTLESIRNAKNHNHLVEEIRERALNLNKKNWKIGFKWVKVHVGIYGNEIADRLKKGGNSKPPHHIQQDTEKCYKKTSGKKV